MKHLYEYEEQDVQGLMRDLETVGHEQMKGWYMQTVSADGGYTMGRIIFAHNEEEIVEIFRKEFRIFTGDPSFPSKIGDSWSSGKDLHKSFLDAFLKYCTYSDKFSYLSIIKDLKVKDAASKKPGIIAFPDLNPFLTSEQLEKNFYNAKEKMTSPEFREEFEDETGTLEI
jgi:hypothetical protein